MKKVSDVVKKGQHVKVKVLSVSGSKLSLSIRVSGKGMKTSQQYCLVPRMLTRLQGGDLNPTVNRMLATARGDESTVARNPEWYARGEVEEVYSVKMGDIEY